MKIHLFAIAGLVALSLPAKAETAMTDIALKALGGLNGTALHCKYIDQSVKMRKAAVETLPKSRKYGEDFETATNDAFLNASKTGATCPDKAAFENDVASAIGLLKGAFGKK